MKELFGFCSRKEAKKWFLSVENKKVAEFSLLNEIES